MTEKKLKQILQIGDWAEVRKPEQFLTLMNYYYDLSPGVRERVIGKIPDILTLTEEFKDYCANGIVEYEPSIVLVLTRLVEDIRRVLGDGERLQSPKKRREASILFEVFSEWFGDYGEVQCTLGHTGFVCNIAEAVEIAVTNEKARNKKDLMMMMLTRERLEIMARQEARAHSETKLDMDTLREMVDDDFDPEMLKNNKKYLQ
ncbi:MAG: hypothetical protein IJG57_05010 [Firmicutes bacterium]|jgi:hypothetical protein|nr:hypothetical protein [Bacillota bacterium]